MDRPVALMLIVLIVIALAGCQPVVMRPTPTADSKLSKWHPVAAGILRPVPKSAEIEEPSRPERLILPTSSPLPDALQDFLSEEEPPLVPYFADFPLSQHPRVERRIRLYTGPQKTMFRRWLERSGRYVPRIQMIFADQGVPLDLAYLAMIESGFILHAYSWAHAAGPWQFIESTGRHYGLTNDWWQDERLDPFKATRAAASYLKYLHQRFDGNWYLAVAGYNAGGGTVNRAVRASDSRDFWTLIEGSVLRAETRDYLPKLLAALTIISDLEGYGFGDLEPELPLAYDVMTVPETTDLDIIANFAGVDYQQIKMLNPELKRWSTPPGVKNYRLRVPAGTGPQVARHYASLPADQRARYHRHQIRAGDTLLKLAKRYAIRLQDIMTLNQIRNPRALQIGDNLILPLREGYNERPLDALNDSYARSSYRRSYKVRSGDSLWSIARRFGVTEKQLRVWNKLGWSNIIRPGQQLKVSGSGGRGGSDDSQAIRRLVYEVLPGDTLWDIGRQFDVATDEIMRWNDLSRDDLLQPGQKLTLLISPGHRG